MASLYRNGDFVKELISCVLGREVDLDGTPRPAGVRTLQGVRNHGAKKLTLDAYAKFRDRAQPASRGHFRLAVLQSGKGRTVIEAQGQPQEHAAPRARVHSALDTIYAFA